MSDAHRLTQAEREQLLIAWPWPKEAATTAEGFDHVARVVETIVRARLAPIEALADRWEQSFAEGRAMRDEYGNADGVSRFRPLDKAAADVRTAVSTPPGQTTATGGDGRG